MLAYQTVTAKTKTVVFHREKRISPAEMWCFAVAGYLLGLFVWPVPHLKTMTVASFPKPQL